MFGSLLTKLFNQSITWWCLVKTEFHLHHKHLVRSCFCRSCYCFKKAKIAVCFFFVPLVVVVQFLACRARHSRPLGLLSWSFVSDEISPLSRHFTICFLSFLASYNLIFFFHFLFFLFNNWLRICWMLNWGTAMKSPFVSILFLVANPRISTVIVINLY